MIEWSESVPYKKHDKVLCKRIVKLRWWQKFINSIYTRFGKDTPFKSERIEIYEAI